MTHNNYTDDLYRGSRLRKEPVFGVRRRERAFLFCTEVLNWLTTVPAELNKMQRIVSEVPRWSFGSNGLNCFWAFQIQCVELSCGVAMGFVLRGGAIDWNCGGSVHPSLADEGGCFTGDRFRQAWFRGVEGNQVHTSP